VSKLHRVLTGVDFSEPARAAFDHALALSRRHDAELTVVHAVPSDRPFGWHARERIALIASLRAAAHTAGVRFKVSVQHGDPAGVILLHANARRADLIVLGTSERSGLDRLRFGSVAEAVALGATQPVLVVPASGKGAAASAPFRNILVPVDFSAGSREAVERALSMANGDSRVTVVHVVRGMPFERSFRYPHHLMEPEYQRQLARVAWRRIAEMIPADAKTARNVHVRVVTGEPAAEIARVAKESDADLVLVGVTARGAIGRMVFGSTAARVIRTAGRPVLAVPQLVGDAARVVDGNPLAVAA
jgi:nucleotide-binding universal stress UspA family protein